MLALYQVIGSEGTNVAVEPCLVANVETKSWSSSATAKTLACAAALGYYTFGVALDVADAESVHLPKEDHYTSLSGVARARDRSAVIVCCSMLRALPWHQGE